jgi:hypothetical protein
LNRTFFPSGNPTLGIVRFRQQANQSFGPRSCNQIVIAQNRDLCLQGVQHFVFDAGAVHGQLAVKRGGAQQMRHAFRGRGFYKPNSGEGGGALMTLAGAT